MPSARFTHAYYANASDELVTLSSWGMAIGLLLVKATPNV